MLARSAATIARKSRTYPSGAPWKLPLDSTRPSRVTTGMSIAAASSRSAAAVAWASVARAPPAPGGAHGVGDRGRVGERVARAAGGGGGAAQRVGGLGARVLRPAVARDDRALR